MGTSVSRPISTGRDDVADSRGLSLLTRPAFLSRSNSRPVKVSKEHFARTLHDSSCYWVYARFSVQHIFETQRFYALDIKEKKYVLLPDHPMNTYSANASSVLDYNLYVIGGRSGQFTSMSVHLFDPVLNDWSDTNRSAVPRQAALAVSVDGKVYVFGGCNKRIFEWGEVYEPSTRIWTTIPRSQVLIEALDRGLSPLRASAVLGKKIILRGYRTGIALDVMSNSWTAVSENLMKSWSNCIRAAVVQNMLITCHCEYDYDQRGTSQLTIRAYDPEEDVWLMLEGIDESFHENAHRSHFMSVNGKLVIYHMWEQNDLRYSIIDIQRLGTTVMANLLWQSRFPMANIIKQGLNIHLQQSVYKQSWLEALRADGL